MGFDRRDIRRGMDVYTLDNAYLGTVLSVVEGQAWTSAEQMAEGAHQSSVADGERLGPAPTVAVGNTGPSRQAAQALYATPSDGAGSIGRGALVVGKWWGLAGRRTIPLDLVQTVSLERVVLKVKAAAVTSG
ncbi:MAG: hypothetical protein ACRDI2_20235 [Chloroflexota bacterium]